MGKFRQISRAVKAKPWKSLGIAVGSAAVAGSVAYILFRREKKRRQDEEAVQTVSVRSPKEKTSGRKKSATKKKRAKRK